MGSRGGNLTFGFGYDTDSRLYEMPAQQPAPVVGERVIQVIGVTPASFYGLEVGQNFDAALPICSEPVFSTNLSRPSLMDSPDAWWLAVIGRLKPGWTPEG